jgi:isochorismate hydrolase
VLARQAVDVLRQVARVFDYQAYFVCLFHKKDAVSPFVEQRLLFNIYPLEDHMRKNKVWDHSTGPSAFAPSPL